jgi:DNA-binding winged helix-turn-helix (wHTH) protein
MLYSFANCELDTDLYELRRAGEAVPLEPLAFNVLTYLVQHRDRTVSKDELIEHLWSGQFLGDSCLVQSVVKARRAMGDNGHEQRCIKTVTGHGYRFTAPVEEHDVVGRETQARAPTPIQFEAPSMMTLRAMAPWQGEAGLGLQELLVAGRVQGLALVHGLPEQAEDDQGQVVLLVLHLCLAHTAQAQQDAQCINEVSNVLQRCLTKPVPQPGSAQRLWNMPGGSPVASGWVRAGARRNCCVQALGRR